MPIRWHIDDSTCFTTTNHTTTGWIGTMPTFSEGHPKEKYKTPVIEPLWDFNEWKEWLLKDDNMMSEETHQSFAYLNKGNIRYNTEMAFMEAYRVVMYDEGI